MRPCRLLAGLVPAVLLLLAVAAFGAQPEDAASRVQTIVAEGRNPILARPDFGPQTGEMWRFYESAGYSPAWFLDGRPRPAAAMAISALRDAVSQGLTPGDYDVLRLDEELRTVTEGGSPGGQALALLDTALSVSLLRYLSDLHTGRVNPGSIGFKLDIQPKKRDLSGLLREGIASGRLTGWLAEAEPAYPMYGRLKAALARYRALAAQPLPLPLPQPDTRKVEPGQPYAGAGALRQLLAAYGDLPPDAAAGPEGLYDPVLADAVKRFQARHGLEPDGVLGKSTLPALNVPPAERVRQIELALERMRWLPEPSSGPAIGINIPEFKLWAFDQNAGHINALFRLDVVVGKAMNTRTPVFANRMQYVVFSPYWNVPPSIARKEIIPDLRKNPGYLAEHDMELVSNSTATPVDAEVNEETLAAIRQGKLRVRQRPGPKNALGGIKFVFPNTEDVYLHDTPAKSLFRQSRRDFSHGCIRVSDPVRLARFVFRDMPEWTEEKIAEAMRAGVEKHVRLKQPIPVVIFYTTVIVEEDGTTRFLPDIYGHDRTLELALKEMGRL
jgi:murein L,D-transpeptidase YcbB/YkuD